MKTANEMRANCGPKLKLMKWGFPGMVSPFLTYGSMIWGHAVNTKTCKDKLRQLNRLACNTIAGIRRSNPTRALEIIYDLPPLHLVIMRSGLRSYARLQRQLECRKAANSTKQLKKNSHLHYWDKLASKANIELTTTDTIGETIRTKKYKGYLESFNGKKKHL